MTGFPVNADATMHHDGARPVSDRCALGAQRRGGSPTLPKRRFLDTLAAGLLLAIGSIGVWVITACAGGAHMAAPSVQLTGAVTSVEERGEPSVRAFSGPMIPLEPASTVSQRNAVRTAEDYLDYTAFSREGLIQQLEYEGFSTEDATSPWTTSPWTGMSKLQELPKTTWTIRDSPVADSSTNSNTTGSPQRRRPTGPQRPGSSQLGGSVVVPRPGRAAYPHVWWVPAASAPPPNSKSRQKAIKPQDPSETPQRDVRHCRADCRPS